MKEKHFVKTSDPNTAKYLREAGFPELAKEGERWVFVNLGDIQMDFAEKDMKMNFDDKLMF